MARDFDPNTGIWHLRSRPHILHEIGDPITGEIKSQGSDTTALPNGGVKEPDAGIGLTKRALQTIVIEVGCSESRAKLRLDAQRWLQTGLPDRSRVKRKRELDEDAANVNPRPVMLVMLISFEGQRLDKSF
ncbi:hypothetical protein Q9L58_002651 [Maublancomyces gigas]|uniref:Uncharacterized protein n=1 Tax=Discina gigas TaxID=1032678 RepID=A0ABR3GR01_9PEZI